MVSAVLCIGIPTNPINCDIKFHNALPEFARDVAKVIKTARGRFSLMGTSGFWMASAVLRLAVFSWLPVAFGIHDNATIGMMISLSGVGLIVGAYLTPRLIPVGDVSRVIGAGALMGLGLLLLPWTSGLTLALSIQTLSGSLGGMYVIPLNAMLQRVGEQTIGTGKIVAIQNFAENSLMLIGVLLYLAAAREGGSVIWIMTANGAALLGIVLLLFGQRKSLVS